MATDYSKISAARRQKLEKDPGTRSKIPTKYLSAQYRQQRLLNQRLNAPVTEGSSLTNREAAQQRNAIVEQKYGQAERQSQAVQQAIPQWYQNYKDQIAAAQAGQQAGYQAALQQFQTLQQGTTAQQGQAETAAYQQQAAQLGGAGDPAAAQRAAQAAAIRGAAVGSVGSVLAAQGANQAAYGAQQQVTAGQSQLEALQKELNNAKEIGLAKGAYATQTDQSIKDAERKNVLENAAFNLNVSNTAADNQRADAQVGIQQQNARTAAENAAASRARAQAQLNKYGFTNDQWKRMAESEKQKWRTGAYSRTAGGKKQTAPRQEPGTSLQPRRLINARAEFVKTYAKQHGFGISSPAQRAQLVASLRKDHSGFFDNGGTNEHVLRAALDLANGGPIGSSTLQYLRRQGIFVASDGSYAGAVNH